MERLNKAELIDVAGILSLIAMLAYMAVLFIRFVRKHMAVAEQHYAVYIQSDFNCPYARKRVAKRVVHDCKLTVFTGNPNSWAGLFG